MIASGLRVCSKCGVEKPLDDFYNITVKKGAYVWRGMRSRCKACDSAGAKGRSRPAKPGYSREYQRKRREANKLVLNALKNKPCADCGVQYPPCVMDFDHLRDKKYVIGWAKNLAVATLIAETAKCDVVCSNCHRIRTHSRQQLHAERKVLVANG